MLRPKKYIIFLLTRLQEAGNEGVRNRVEKISICSLRAVLETCGQPILKDGMIKVLYPKKYGNIIEQYMALTKKHGQNHAEEWQPIEHYYGLLAQYNQTGFRAEQVENKYWRITVLPGENGKIVEMYYKPEKRDLLSPPGSTCPKKIVRSGSI